MRPGQQNKRGRGRGNNNNNGGGGNNNNFNRKGSNPLTRTYDSSGPDVKIRGTAQHIAEKYSTLARDAQSAGDRVMAENYLQHAEHYNRIIAAAQSQMQERFQRDDRTDYNDRDGDDMDVNSGDLDDVAATPAPPQQQEPVSQPVVAQQPQAPQQPRQPRRQQERQPSVQQPAPVAVVAEQRLNTGSGPQPVIEGTPAEVAIEAETAAEAAAPREKTPRRRAGAATRPRRQPRRSAEEGAEGEGASSEAPALETAASE